MALPTGKANVWKVRPKTAAHRRADAKAIPVAREKADDALENLRDEYCWGHEEGSDRGWTKLQDILTLVRYKVDLEEVGINTEVIESNQDFLRSIYEAVSQCNRVAITISNAKSQTSKEYVAEHLWEDGECVPTGPLNTTLLRNYRKDT
jgi:hypothetical protein